MKKQDIPQQPHEMFNGESKGLYVVNEQGEYELSQTTGWQPETDVLELALEEIARLSNDALSRARQGLCSPLEYHMYHQRLDLPMLAKAVGKFKWQVRRHFDPKRFKKLNQQTLELYASVLGISIDTLTQLPDE